MKNKLHIQIVDVSIINSTMKDIALEEVFVFLMERTERQMRRYKNAALKKEGIEISSDHWVMLKRISEREMINQRELAERTFRDPASVTRSLDSLEREGLVQRVDTEHDRRAYNLILTTEGKALVNKITPIAMEIRAQGLKNISAEDLQVFKTTLNKIYENYA